MTMEKCLFIDVFYSFSEAIHPMAFKLFQHQYLTDTLLELTNWASDQVFVFVL